MSDFASDEELVERLRRWWSENGLALIAAVVLAVAGVLGWRWYQDWRAESAAAAAEAYAAYLDARAVGENASGLFDAIATEHEGSVYHVFALLFEAKDALAAADHEGAVERLTQSVAVADEAVLRDAARVRLARVFYQLDRPEDALKELSAVQGAGYADDVAELTGDIHLRQGAVGAARAAYQSAFDAVEAAPRRGFLEMKLRSLPPAVADAPSADTLGAAEAETRPADDAPAAVPDAGASPADDAPAALPDAEAPLVDDPPAASPDAEAHSEPTSPSDAQQTNSAEGAAIDAADSSAAAPLDNGA